MPNSTDTYWEIDGVSLQTYAQNIETLGGTRDAMPAWRGDDRVFAYRDGAEHRDHVADSRTLSLAMWVKGLNSDGSRPADQRAKYAENRRAIKQAFWAPRGRLLPLTKRWVAPDGSIMKATAMCRLANDMAPEQMGPVASKFVVDVHLPDPWFYGDEVSTPLALNTPTAIQNLGDDETSIITVTYTGQLSNALLTNTTPNPDVWMKLGYALAGGASPSTAVIDVDGESAKNTTLGSNLIGAVQHSGSRAWFALARGGNSVVLTADAGAGSAVLKHRPKFF